MVNKLIAISTIVLALTTQSYPALGENKTSAVVKHIETRNTLSLESMAIAQKSKDMKAAIRKLKTHVGKTWYVFSGSTPRGWDCSGLTMWTYQQLGIELQHRATKQQSAGVATNKPKVGDIVVFKYHGSKYAYHVGIYIGNGKMIHAPKHGHLTRSESIKTFAGNYSEVSYRRIIKTV